MALFKRDEDGESGGSAFARFFASLPLFKKEDPEWDDGSDNPKPSLDAAKGKLIYLIMTAYGSVAGFFGCQYCRYLHQRFACAAWGIPLTSRPVKTYSTPNLVVDIIAVGCVYGLLILLGWLLDRLLKVLFANSLPDCEEYCNIGLMYGFLFLVLLSVIMCIVPFNVFLIGIP